MQFFWLRSTDSEISTSPAALPHCSVLDVPEEARGEDSVMIAEIACDADVERAVNWLEGRARSIPVWIFDPSASVRSSVSWMKSGAAHVTASIDELESAMDAEEWSRGPAEVQTITPASTTMIGGSRSMREVAAAIHIVKDRQCGILIEGETGTGKEVVAREIHNTGRRSRGPWVAVNCSAIPEPLLEAELFGYLKGAFTGAQQSRAGKFEAANHGTIFLDEIGDMPLGIQAKLLRVLQEREVERLGGNERVRLDIRIIAATNVNLAERVKDGRFRQDLFYRLNVFQIVLPPLRERPDDIPQLARHFVAKICTNEGLPIKSLDRSAMEKLRSMSWPGNVRELENALEAAVIVSGDRNAIFAGDLRMSRPVTPESVRPRTFSLPAEGMDFQRALEDFEVAVLTQALSRVRGNKTAAADLLGLKRTTLAAKMKSLEGRFAVAAA